MSNIKANIGGMKKKKNSYILLGVQAQTTLNHLQSTELRMSK